ncbi:MAG: M23 family metallopeptidase [Flavobacteriaceae bacterium]|nr:M23 family metallopeptidase [Flavobacteriaceae bacterium]
MTTKNKDTRKLRKKLLHKYRLVILNEDTFEERFAIKLTRLNVFVIMSILTIFLIISTTLLIAFTPLREYIPGYSSTALKKNATRLNYKTDSLEQIITMNDEYINSIKRVLTGEVNTADFNNDSIIEAAELDISAFNINPSKEDSLLREKVDKEDKYSLFESATSRVNFVLFPPVTGTISEGYNAKEKHYAIDIVVPKDTPIKATGEGTVIFAEWTTQTGYVLLLDHGNGLLSVYKHNASLTKEQGDLVKSGEVVAISGNSGEFTTGPHLHFELWKDGHPVNPSTFIDFE